MLCRPCHRQVHALFTNEDLRNSDDTIESLRDAEPLQEDVDWIRGAEKLDIQITTSNRVCDRRG